MTETQIVVDAEYRWCLATCFLIVIHNFFLGFWTMFGPRSRYFTKDFLDQINLEGGKKPAGLGYPDSGTGRYSDRLEYKDWVLLNAGMRVHQNSTETIVPAIIGIAVSGIFFPYISTGLAIGYFLTRLLYGYMYANLKAVEIPYILNIIFVIGSIGLAGYGCYKPLLESLKQIS